MADDTEERTQDTFLEQLKAFYGPRGMFSRVEAQALSSKWPQWEEYLEQLVEFGRVDRFNSTSYRIVA